MSKRSTIKIEGNPGFFQDTKNGTIYFIRSVDGRLIKFSCKTTSLVTAKRYANQRLKDVLAETKPDFMPLLGHWIDLFIKYREGLETSDSSKRISTVAMKQAKPYWEKMRPDQVTRDEWLKFCEWHRTKYAIQLESTHKYFRNFLKWLEDTQYNGKPVLLRRPNIQNPESKRVRLQRKQKKSRVFTEAEVKVILEHCHKTRDRLLIMLMYTMAFRVKSDALSARWDQFRLDETPPVYVFGEEDNKAGLEGKQAVNKHVFELLKQHRANSIKSKWVFPQTSNPDKHIGPQMIDWDGIRNSAKLGWHWTPHTFRHTCLTMLAEANYPTHLICQCFRISPAEFLNTYAHLTRKGIMEMQNAITFND